MALIVILFFCVNMKLSLIKANWNEVAVIWIGHSCSSVYSRKILSRIRTQYLLWCSVALQTELWFKSHIYVSVASTRNCVHEISVLSSVSFSAVWDNSGGFGGVGGEVAVWGFPWHSIVRYPHEDILENRVALWSVMCYTEPWAERNPHVESLDTLKNIVAVLQKNRQNRQRIKSAAGIHVAWKINRSASLSLLFFLSKIARESKRVDFCC